MLIIYMVTMMGRGVSHFVVSEQFGPNRTVRFRKLFWQCLVEPTPGIQLCLEVGSVSVICELSNLFTVKMIIIFFYVIF